MDALIHRQGMPTAHTALGHRHRHSRQGGPAACVQDLLNGRQVLQAPLKPTLRVLVVQTKNYIGEENERREYRHSLPEQLCET